MVVVESWRQEMTQNGGIEVSGQLKNSGADVAGNITVEVEAVDENGKAYTAAGFLDKTSLVRNARTAFRALFPDLSQLEQAAGLHGEGRRRHDRAQGRGQEKLAADATDKPEEGRKPE